MVPKGPWSRWELILEQQAGVAVTQLAGGGVCAASCNVMWLLHCSMSPARGGRNQAAPTTARGTQQDSSNTLLFLQGMNSSSINLTLLSSPKLLPMPDADPDGETEAQGCV